MNELFQIQPQWARARCLRRNPLAIGVEMPDRPMRAERPFTPLLLLLAIVYLMAVLTPTSAIAARLDSAEALAAWAKSKNWTKTSYGIGYKSDKINSFDIWIVYDRTPTLIPFNESWESGGRNPEAVTRTGENITIAGGIPATLLYNSLVHEDSGHESEKWEYYCHDYRVLMRAHRDTRIGQAGSDPLALLENYIAFVNKYLNVKPPKDENCKEDKDCDGIPDDVDKCCKTPKGHKGDKSGCPICPSGTIYDPSSEKADKKTGCSPKVAVVFTTDADPSHRYVEKKAMFYGIAALKERYRKEGYKIIDVPLPGKKVGVEWHSDMGTMIKYLTRPSTKAMAFFGHGGRMTKKVDWEFDIYTPTLGGHQAGLFYMDILNKLKPLYMEQYCLSKKDAFFKADAKANNIGLEDAYMFACHSLDDNSMRNFLVSPKTGVYWGDKGIYFGMLKLDKVTGAGK